MPALVSALNRVDLPTLGRPTIPHLTDILEPLGGTMHELGTPKLSQRTWPRGATSRSWYATSTWQRPDLPEALAANTPMIAGLSLRLLFDDPGTATTTRSLPPDCDRPDGQYPGAGARTAANPMPRRCLSDHCALPLRHPA